MDVDKTRAGRDHFDMDKTLGPDDTDLDKTPDVMILTWTRHRA